MRKKRRCAFPGTRVLPRLLPTTRTKKLFLKRRRTDQYCLIHHSSYSPPQIRKFSFYSVDKYPFLLTREIFRKVRLVCQQLMWSSVPSSVFHEHSPWSGSCIFPQHSFNFGRLSNWGRKLKRQFSAFFRLAGIPVTLWYVQNWGKNGAVTLTKSCCRVRIHLHWFVTRPFFDGFIMFVILLSSVALALEDPVKEDSERFIITIIVITITFPWSKLTSFKYSSCSETRSWACSITGSRPSSPSSACWRCSTLACSFTPDHTWGPHNVPSTHHVGLIWWNLNTFVVGMCGTWWISLSSPAPSYLFTLSEHICLLLPPFVPFFLAQISSGV